MVKKWTQTRDTWMRCIKNQKKIKKNGASAKSSRLYVFHSQLSFLKKITGTNVAHESTHATSDEEHETNEEMENEENDQVRPREGHVSESEKPIDSSDKKKDTTNNRKRKKYDDVDAKMMTFIDYQMNPPTKIEDEDRHLSFFKSLLPSLSSLDDDETLEFQAGVISVLRNLKRNKEIRQDSRPVETSLNEKQRLGTVTQPYSQISMQPLQYGDSSHLTPSGQHYQLPHAYNYLPQQQQRGYISQSQLPQSYHEQISQPQTPASHMDMQSPAHSQISGADSILSRDSQGMDDDLNF